MHTVPTRYITSHEKITMHVNMELPDAIAEIITTVPVHELKKRILTANGLTLAQEEAILALDLSDTTEAMSPEEAVALLQQLRNED